MRLVAAALNFVFLASVQACNVPPAERGDRSEVTSITVGLPDRTPLKARVPNIETQMNAYQLWVTPVDPNCAGATKINQIGDYKATADVLDFKLQQGCDYDVVLALGHKSGSAPTSAAQLTYESDVKAILDKSCISCHSASNPLRKDLSTYSAARAVGSGLVTWTANGAMPPSGALAQSEQEKLKKWSDAGFPEKASAPSTTDTGKLTAAYYQNGSAYRITKESIQGRETVTADISVQLTSEGKSLGL